MKKAIVTDKAPRAIGPYSQAVEAGGFVFVSGQIAIDPGTGTVAAGDAAAQVRQVMENLRAVLAAGGCSLDQVVRTTLYLRNMEDFTAVNDVYAAFFSGTPPARATVEVSRLPKDVLVEIDAIAWRG